MTKNVMVLDEADRDGGGGGVGAIQPVFKHPIFNVISTHADDDIEDLRKYLDLGPDHPDHVQDINLEDESGMSALMHAAWKGKEKSAKYLIQQVKI